MFSRVGEWCLNTKINFFISRNTIYLLFLNFFYLFLGGEIGRYPEVTAVSLVPVASENPELPHWVRLAGRVRGRPPPGTCGAAVPLASGMARAGSLSLGIDSGGTPWHAVGVGWAGRETQWTLFSFFAFIFIKEKGACQLSSLCYMILYVVLFLFCFVNCIIFKYLSFKKRRKTTKKKSC